MKAKKRQVRNQAMLSRKVIDKKSREEKSAQIFARLKEEEAVKNAKRVMVYVNFQEEVETRDLMEYLWGQGVELAVPITDPVTRSMQASLVESFADLVPGNFGVLEPSKWATKIIIPDTIDLVIVPGLAFDRQGGRIGYGAGYYDRFFAQVPEADLIALAFAEQMIDWVPMEDHDRYLPKIVTDQEVINIK